MKICPKCGREYDDDKNFCSQCGVRLVYKEKDTNIIALKSEVEASSGDILAYKSQVKSSGEQAKVAKQDVMAVRSKVAGGHIVEGNYIHESIHIINVSPELFKQQKEYSGEEFYLIYLDEHGNERNIKATGNIEIYRREGTWDVVVWDGNKEIEMGIRDMGISRKKRRVKIWVENGKYHIKDYGMRNGVYLNGRRIKDEDILSPGDIVKISTLTFRVEKNPDEISVKRNSIMFISPEVAKELPQNLVFYADGKYFLNALGLREGEVIKAGGKKIVVKDSTIRESVMISRELLSDVSDELFYQMIEEMNDEISPELREKIDKLLNLYKEAEENVKYLYKKEILRLLGGEK